MGNELRQASAPAFCRFLGRDFVLRRENLPYHTKGFEKIMPKCKKNVGIVEKIGYNKVELSWDAKGIRR